MPHTPLPHRSVLRLSGDDRGSFLQGLISNDINLCTPGNAIYAALLTPQGKFLHDMFVIADNDAFLIEAEAARLTDLHQRLNRHKLRAKITIEDLSANLAVHATWADTTADTGHTYRDPRLPELGARFITPKSEPPVKDPAPFETYDQHRLALGVADGSRDMIIEKSTLLEGNFDLLNGISWTKGCYMGQELTARTHYRGLVKKRLHRVDTTGPVDPGTPIFFQNTEIGEMRSSSGPVGLALLNVETTREAIAASIPLSCGTVTLTPRVMPWLLPHKVP